MTEQQIGLYKIWQEKYDKNNIFANLDIESADYNLIDRKHIADFLRTLNFEQTDTFNRMLDELFKEMVISQTQSFDAENLSIQPVFMKAFYATKIRWEMPIYMRQAVMNFHQSESK